MNDDELYQQVTRWVRGFVAKKPEFARDYQDLIQSAMVRVIPAYRKKIEEGGVFDKRFGNYLRIITRNAIASHLRHEYVRRPESRIHTLCTYHETLLEPRTDADEGYVLDVVRTGRDWQDAKIILDRFIGYTFSEIATRIGLSRATVWARFKRIRGRINYAHK